MLLCRAPSADGGRHRRFREHPNGRSGVHFAGNRFVDFKLLVLCLFLNRIRLLPRKRDQTVRICCEAIETREKLPTRGPHERVQFAGFWRRVRQKRTSCMPKMQCSHQESMYDINHNLPHMRLIRRLLRRIICALRKSSTTPELVCDTVANRYGTIWNASPTIVTSWAGWVAATSCPDWPACTYPTSCWSVN